MDRAGGFRSRRAAARARRAGPVAQRSARASATDTAPLPRWSLHGRRNGQGCGGRLLASMRFDI